MIVEISFAGVYYPFFTLILLSRRLARKSAPRTVTSAAPVGRSDTVENVIPKILPSVPTAAPIIHWLKNILEKINPQAAGMIKKLKMRNIPADFTENTTINPRLK